VGESRKSSETPIDDSPCVGCGLCCDGTLFTAAKAEPHEEKTLMDLGLSLQDQDGKRYVSLPCHFCRNGLCTIYYARFSKCRSFECKLLKGVNDGSLSRKSAAEKVRMALQLRSMVAAEEPSAVGISERQRLLRVLRATSERPRLQLSILALDHFLDRWFRNKNPQLLRVDETQGHRSTITENPLENPPVNS
jgi:hypothetical protein